MRAFKVYINGKRVCLAGIGDHGVLTSVVDWVPGRGEGKLAVGGLISDLNEHVEWVEQRLEIGDEVTIKIVEAESSDVPKERKPRDPAKELEAQKNYVRVMAKKLGWKIEAKTKKPTPR